MEVNLFTTGEAVMARRVARVARVEREREREREWQREKNEVELAAVKELKCLALRAEEPVKLFKPEACTTSTSGAPTGAASSRAARHATATATATAATCCEATFGI